MGAEAKANRSKYRVELVPHRNPEMGRFGNSELFPLLRSELDACRGSGEGSTQRCSHSSSTTGNEHSCSYLQARMQTSHPLISRQYKMGVGQSEVW